MTVCVRQFTVSRDVSVVSSGGAVGYKPEGRGFDS